MSYTIDNLDELLEMVIQGKHGWAVSEQFNDTWNGESAEDKNGNAMEAIVETLQSLVENDLVSEYGKREIQNYLNRVENELNPSFEDEDDEENEENINENKKSIRIGKFVITEEERTRIRGLYEGAGSETITGQDLATFTQNIRTQTMGKTISTAPGSISINVDKLTLTYKVDPNVTPLTRLSLAYGDGTKPGCEACVNIKRENNGSGGKYFAKEVANGNFQNGTREYMLFAIYPPGSVAI